MTDNPNTGKLIELQRELSQLDMKDWLEYDALSPEWWTVIGIFVISWVAFLKLVDRKRLPELVLVMFSVIFITETLDHLGYELGFWYYPVEMLPLFPRFEEVNLSVLPVTYTLIYQYLPDWRRFIFALIIMSGIFTFVAEPLLIKMNLYMLLKWKSIYGFPIYIAVGMAVKWFVEALGRTAAEHRK